MDSLSFPEEVSEKRVSIIGSELVENYTVYVIEVKDGDHKWTVKHRYSDFHDLHEKLTAEKKVDKHLLPPKKMLGKNSKSLVEKRQKELEVYLQTLLLQFPTATPQLLSTFLLFNLYEINGITAALAEELFNKGEQLLVAGEVFSLRPLQLYAVSQQLRLAKPTCSGGDAKTDLGHILDFTCRLKYLKIPGTRGQVGTSNIQEDNLPFDLSIFKSLIHIEISECSSQQIQGLPFLRDSLATLSLHLSADSMMSILVPEARDLPQWEAEGVDSGSPVTAIVPLWRNLTTLDMSHNHISCIDHSVKLTPKVEFLDLSHNQLSSVENLQHLYNLVHLDLSYNHLTVLEGVHTRLGNIKTLNLAGNQLESLTGLSKLYSLVNLDLNSNRLAQLEEIQNIGSLPCLEKLNLANNPLCIVPDYRTKVLAQFWDRAAEVCLDCTATTEKELDTVEVLKAIQKAKKAKDRMNNSEKKISEETRLSAGGVPHSSSSSSSSCSSSAVAPPAPPSSSSCPPCQAQQAASSSQEVKRNEEEVTRPAMTPIDVAPLPQQCLDNNQPVSTKDLTQLQAPPPAASPSCQMSSCQQPVLPSSSCLCSDEGPADSGGPFQLSPCPVLPSHLLSLSSSSELFITQLSQLLSSSLKEQGQERGRSEEEEQVRQRLESEEGKSNEEETDLCSPSPSSRDGYFEMGLDDSLEEVLGPGCSSSPLPHPAPPTPEENSQGSCQEEALQQQGQKVPVCVRRVGWCHCVRVEKVLEQRQGCLVLTEGLLGLFLLPEGRHCAQDTDKDQDSSPEEVLSSLQKDLLVPFSDVLLSQCYLPTSCLALGLRSSQARWYLFSHPQDLSFIRAELTSLLAHLQITCEPQDGPPPTQSQTPQQFLRHLLSSWEMEESQGAEGGYPAHLLLPLSSSSSSPTHPPSQPSESHPVLADLLSHSLSPEVGGESASVPCLLFLTQRQLCVLKVDFMVLAAQDGSNAECSSSSSSPSSWSKLIRVPLGSVAVHPRQRAPEWAQRDAKPCPNPGHAYRWSHALELVVGHRRLVAVFPLAQDKLSFLGELTQRRASLDGVKTLVLPSARPCQHQGRLEDRDPVCCCCRHKQTQSVRSQMTSHPHGSLSQPGISLVLPSNSLAERLDEENQASPHLPLSQSPGLALVSGLEGQQLLEYFQQSVAQSEGEELRQVLWLSVVLYKSPEAELTACLLLSNNAIYFLLEDSASQLNSHTVWDVSEVGTSDPDLVPCCCLTIKLCDLLSVNVGLFDQYFRVVGRSAEQIVCCLSRDSYGTHRFLQQLMSVLSLQDKVPSPEPSEQDFYTQFGNKTTGKMQNYELVHSSRVKFIYPSEEEMGDLTFIVAERKTPVSTAALTCSFNILLYLLVFQVQLPSSPTSPGSSPSQPGSSPVLQPRTLILTSTDVFLLEEDYISYPLPDFAKEPPSREKYQLREARRIRDLDRVLLGYQTYPQALTMVFDDLPGPDLLCHLTMDHFTAGEEGGRGGGGVAGAEGEVQWCIFVPGADSRERLICLLARQWEALCSRELPVELTG